MHAAAAEPTPPLWHDALAASANALLVLALVLTLGMLAFSPLGAAGAATGVSAGLKAVIFGGLVFALASRSRLPLVGPSSPTALVLAGLVAQLLADPQLDAATPAGLAALLQVTAATVMLMGALQLLMALIGLGRLVLFVPQPVLAGFMNGVAIVIVFKQVPPLLGLASLSNPGDALAAQPVALALGLVTAVAATFAARRWPRMPSTLFGLGCGTAAYLLCIAVWPAAPVGPLVGALPNEAMLLPTLLPPFDAPGWALLQRHATTVALSACVLALIGTLETLLYSAAVDQITSSRSDTQRELLAVAAANMASGLWGGLPLGMSRLRAISLHNSGTQGRRPALLAVPALVLLALTALPLLSPLPRALLAGMMLALAFALFDQWSRQLLQQWRGGDNSPELRASLAMVAVVAAVTIGLGFVAAVALGVALSLLVFLRGLNLSLLRARSTAAERPSRRIYSPAQESWLSSQRQHITLMELQGSLFFGSAERLASLADTLPDSTRALVLDFRRVTAIDATGAVLLHQLAKTLQRRGVWLLLAGVAPDNPHGRHLRSYGSLRDGDAPDWWADADRAIEAAEERLLAASGQALADAGVALAATALLQGLNADDRERVARLLQPQQFAAGQWLFRQGDAADRLYVLTAGSVSIVGADGSGPRYVSYSPGALFGEAAMLDGGGRSAGAIADSDCTVHALTRDTLAQLANEQPLLGMQLMRNVALHLSQRLRGADWAWRAASS